jgi:Leucine-rich repeat (LRR) protein
LKFVLNLNKINNISAICFLRKCCCYVTCRQEGLPIRVLNLRNCSVSRIDSGAFRGLNNLNELNLEYNRLSAGSLRQLDIPGLRVLHISGNNLSAAQSNALEGLPSLQFLALNNAHISKLPRALLSSNKDLTHFESCDNYLKQLGRDMFASQKGLRELRLARNSFLEVPYSSLANLSSLEVLSMSGNLLAAVDVSRLSGLSRLRELDLSQNTISSLSGFASANLSHLLSVDLSSNSLAALPANFFHLSTSLRRLDLARNKFRQIPTAALNLPGLGWLNLTGNPLSRIHDLSSVRLYPSMQEIHISGTNLTIVTSKDFEAFPALLHLFLDVNRISRVSPGAFRSLPSLLTLDLGVNELDLLPQERLQGLNHLRLLNLTHNRLKELEEFPQDLKSLQILDLSFNQITLVGKWTFRHLENLAELHLYGNWISTVASDAFRPLKKLRLLDLSRNYLEKLPLSAFRPLETQIRSLRTEENPLHCGCDSQELWEWLRDHQKLVGVATRGLRCEHPPELRGLPFLDLEPPRFCSTPLILKLAIQDIQPFSVIVSWQSRNHSGLHGYRVAYHALDRNDVVSVSADSLEEYPPIASDLYCVQIGSSDTGAPRCTPDRSQ